MLGASILVAVAAFAATGLADVPAGYKAVYITSLVNSKFVIEPKGGQDGRRHSRVGSAAAPIPTAAQDENHWRRAKARPVAL